MRMRYVALWLLAAMAGALAAPQPASKPPYEIVKDHLDIELSPDGSYVSSREQIMKVLDARGIDLLHERRIAFTQRYERVDIVAAYTLKANGQRIDVPHNGFLSGFGQTSQPGFQDNVMISIFYPNLEVGDSVVLETLHRQIVPWFTGRFDYRADFSRTVPSHDVSYALSAPSSMALRFDQSGLEGSAPRIYGDKTRWIWTFHNDTPISPEIDAVAESDYAPHLVMTSFADYADVAKSYRDRASSASTVTPEIQALADQLTQGVTDKRAQAKGLYDWVSSHIAYVEIVLGAGGFTPHQAKDILANRFGDCKDHVVLLEALLKAKGIDSTAMLIRIGTYAYKLPNAANPHEFDHVITYLPAFNLYLDSTAQLAPFGVLPYSDAGKPVLDVATGALAQTPVPTPANSTVQVESRIALQDDGSAQATSKITAIGAFGFHVRSTIQDIPAGQENQFFDTVLGPGVEGTIDRGDPLNLSEPYVVSASYRLPSAFTVPGPGALTAGLVFKPFSFTQLLAGSLPASRASNYICLSLTAQENTRITFPEGYKLLSIPDPQTLTAEGIRLHTDFDRTDARTVNETVILTIEHQQATCTPEYYENAHSALVKMANTLRQQIIYRGPKENGQ
jgi:transglutaminase-like putative cysteine protease